MGEFGRAERELRRKGLDGIGSAVAWFYLRFLTGSGESVNAQASRVFTPRERRDLLDDAGAMAAAVLRRPAALKKDFLKAQIYDIVEEYGEQVRLDADAPVAVRRELDARVDAFVDRVGGELGAGVQSGFNRGASAVALAGELKGIFSRGAEELFDYVIEGYDKAEEYERLRETGAEWFRFEVEESAGTCAECRSHDGEVYSLEELWREDLIPPVHPNCRCELVPVTGGEEDEVVTAEEILPFVLTDEQLGALEEVYEEILGLLDEGQRARVLRGENLSLILLELAPWERERIEALSAGVVETLSREQLTALMFLSSEVLEGIGLAERVEIWEHLRDNGGKISFDDLVEIGVYEGDELASGGFWRWLQGLDLGGGPANFAGMLEVEYELNSYGTSFAMLDEEQRRERGAQMVVMLAMMAGPVVGRLLTGPSGVVLGDGKLDSIESTGTAGHAALLCCGHGL